MTMQNAATVTPYETSNGRSGGGQVVPGRDAGGPRWPWRGPGWRWPSGPRLAWVPGRRSGC